MDLDGTLLNSEHTISPRTEATLRRAMHQGIHVVIATGRPRYTSQAIIDRLGLTTPGVFLQGLTVYDGTGALLHESLMDPAIAQIVADFSDRTGYTTLVYNSQTILTRKRDALTAIMQQYHEQAPDEIGPLAALPGAVPISKFVFIAPPERIGAIREELKPFVNGSASLLQSTPWLLEALPPGSSKGAGLRWLLDYMGIHPGHVLAIGDGENDLEMIELAGIGVAVGNATEHLKDAANAIVGTNDEDGVAEAVKRFVLEA